MKHYTFCKIKNKGSKEPANWYLLADSLDVINEHWKTYAASFMKEGTKMYLDSLRGCHLGHFSNNFAFAVQVYQESKKCSPMEALVYIENETLQTRLKLYADGEVFYLDKGLTCLVQKGSIEVVETIEKDTLLFPDEESLSMDNVRYLKWGEQYNGFHIYAKIGNLDVVDKNGNQKWSSYEEAHKAAEWFVNNRINKS